MDKASVVRYVTAVAVLVAAFGFDVNAELQSVIVDLSFGAYLLYTVFKNNYLTKKGQAQKEVLEKTKLL